jgi:hypothetical protein
MALIDYYRKYMYGQAPQDLGISGGQRLQEGTTGLFGVGGQTGGGLLNNFQRPDGGAVFDILSNPYVGIGGSLFTAGQRGQSIGQGGMQSVLQGLQFSETASKLQGAKRKRDLIKQYAEQVPPEDKELFEINPEAYIETKLKSRMSEPTLSKEVLAVYNKMKGLSGENFDNAFENLSNAEQSIYRNKIEGNVDLLNRIVEQGMKAGVKPKDFSGTASQWVILKNANKEMTDEEIIKRWNESQKGK